LKLHCKGKPVVRRGRKAKDLHFQGSLAARIKKMEEIEMKKKIILSALVILFVVAASLGATMAWFTDSTPAAAGTFQAGTVDVQAGGAATITGGNKDIVNPGDCFILCWDFVNIGTKRIELRTELTPLWVDQLSIDNVFILPQYASDWVLYEDADGKLWAYYLDGPVAAGDTVSLCLVVYFDGLLTTNAYQGKAFEVQATVEAVQASNNAPSEVWGAAWNVVNAPGYSFNYTDRWGTFDLAKIECYNGSQNGGTDLPPLLWTHG
jgi:predicted ribosomally synthesized peptide with SipW-like signal peptide